jgi:hypothetical protein
VGVTSRGWFNLDTVPPGGPVIVAALAGNSPEVIWKHYAPRFRPLADDRPSPAGDRPARPRGGQELG